MSPRLTFLMLPYTRAELFEWDKLMEWAGVGWRAGMKPDWKALPVAVIRGKRHGFLMKLDRSDWAQRLTYFIGRYYEFGVLRMLDLLLRPGDRFVDIGANIGMITLHARYLVGAAGKVDCFEPNPDCVAAIREHLCINHIENVTVHPYALADAPGSLVLKLTSEHSGTATLADVGAEAVRTLTVEVKVGDEVIIDSAPRLIKIDVEGFELRVLQGLTRTLALHKPFLITELIDSHLAKAGSTVAEVANFLFERGYKAYAIRSGHRKRWMPEELFVRPLLPGSDFSSSSDVLWAHDDQPLDLSKYMGH